MNLRLHKTHSIHTDEKEESVFQATVLEKSRCALMIW